MCSADQGLKKTDLDICPATRHAGANGERKYSSYSFLTSVLDGGE
jgi:hypothetical protein